MRTSHSFKAGARQGYVLIITMVFLAISLITLSSVMWWASSNGIVTQKNELFTTAECAADAATEKVVATLDRDWTYSQALQANSIYTALVPVQTNWPMQFQFSDGSGNNNQTGMSVGVQYYTNQLGSQYAGLAGYIQLCTITSTATTSNQTYSVSATVSQGVYATVIPLFQFAIFYNMNLEIDPGAAMAINGPVHSNAGVWAGTANVTFNSTLGAVGLVYDQATDSTNDDPWCIGKTDSGTPSSNFSTSPIPGEDALTLPVGTSTNNSPSAVEAILNLPPSNYGAPNANAYTTNGQSYLFNESDLIISNSASGLATAKGTNITVWFQDSKNASALTQLQPDVTNIISGTTNKFFSFVTNVSFYDYRESDTVQAVQVDVGKLNTWLSSSTGGRPSNQQSYTDKGVGIHSIYVYNNVPLTGSQLPAVRLINGAQLPYTTDPGGSGRTTGGLTVTTPQPLYVKGNYNVQTNGGAALAAAQTTNTTSTYPAAIMGDAITILSSAWNDANNSSTALSSRNPVNTTINAAALEGIVESTNSNYSGGVENFLRLLENWNGSSTTLQYNGSIVVMFPSIYATGFWQATGNYYNAPIRHWGFDYNFLNPNKLPPITPKFYKIIRSTWAEN